MKKLFLTLMVILISSTVYIKQDPLVEGRYQLFDRGWNRTGYIIRNDLNPNRYDIYDKNWRREGYLRRDRDTDFKYEK